MAYDQGATFGTMNKYIPKKEKKPTTPTYAAPKTTTPKVTTASAIPTVQKSTVIETEKPDWIPDGPSGYSGGTSENLATSAYDDALAALEAEKQRQEEAARIRTQATVDSINANIPKVNQDYENQQTQNYISHTKNLFGLPDLLKSQGLSGGMSESKATELQVGYENNRNTADQNKNNSLQYYEGLAAQARATGDESLAKIATDYYDNLVALKQQQATAETQQSQFEAEQATDASRYQDSLTQQAFENDLATKEYNLAAQRAKTSGTSGGGSGSKLTASTINNMLDSGMIDEDQAAAMYGSIGINIPTQTQPTANYYAEADRLVQQRSTPSSQAALIKQWNIEGKLTDAQASELLRRYGLPNM